jgi:hypothetical protein
MPPGGAHVAGEWNESSHPSSHSGIHRWRALRVPMLLGLLCLVIYNANLRQIGAADTLSARYLPLGLWHFGTLRLDRIAPWVAHGHPSIANWQKLPPAEVSFSPSAYWIVRGRNQHLASFYPIVAPLLVAPLYLPAVAILTKHGWQQPEIDRVAELMEKASASLLATFATVVVYILLRRERNRYAFVIALAFAFGTNTWMISSQALWQHGTGELLIALALLLALSPPGRVAAFALGAVCILITFNRPPDALFAGAIVFHVLWTRKRTLGWLLAGGALPLAALSLYNLCVLGNVAGGYGTVREPVSTFFQHSILEGIAGLLISPARGLLVFSPFLLFVPLGLRHRLRSPASRPLAIALMSAAILQLLVYAPMDWRAGICWGPRYLTDTLPVLAWLLAPAPLVLASFGRMLLGLTIAAGTAVQAIGAFWYTGTSDLAIFAGGPASMHGAWKLANIPFVAELNHAPAGGELQCNTTVVIDQIGGTPQPGTTTTVPILAPGYTISGRALSCSRKPAQLILLVDGVIVGATQQFAARSANEGASQADSPLQWAITAATQNVPPGERVLQVCVRVEPRSDIRIVREQRVKVVSSPPAAAPSPASSALAPMGDVAASTLRSHLRPEGYWLTSYTSQPRFEAPHAEMNTFLTSMMVDFLSPISETYNLDDALGRARRHLAAQIESTGLVRYHGVPDAPTIGTLGCVITPDADDTALVWIVAGSNGDGRRQPMLNELVAFRNARGLYRTWLAPREKYQCLDPGRDPNPADATIQMHVYLMLRELDPPAANALCVALQRTINKDDLWVYYAKAPLIPYLRSAELRRKDCAIPLPEERLAHPVAGQEIWSEVARRLVATMTVPPSVSEREAMIALLTKLGSDEFAELRRAPPLLYHNDLTASVSRYYWSPDFGYALWLRLYNAARGEGLTAP